MLFFYVVVFFQLLLFFYHQITTNIDFFPFNDLEQHPISYRLFESISNGMLMIIPPIGFIWNVEWMIRYSLFFYPLLLVGMFFSWWRHYFFGPTDWWQGTYNKIYSRTIKVLPAIKNNPIPDLQHCILHTIAMITTILTMTYYFMEV